MSKRYTVGSMTGLPADFGEGKGHRYVVIEKVELDLWRAIEVFDTEKEARAFIQAVEQIIPLTYNSDDGEHVICNKDEAIAYMTGAEYILKQAGLLDG